MLESIIYYLIHIGGWMCIIGGFVLVPIIWIITVPYYNNKIGLKHVYDPMMQAFVFTKGIYRAMLYGMLIVIHKGRKKSIERRVYGDLDFNHCARLIDKIICYPFFVLFFGGMLMCTTASVLIGISKLVNL